MVNGTCSYPFFNVVFIYTDIYLCSIYPLEGSYSGVRCFFCGQVCWGWGMFRGWERPLNCRIIFGRWGVSSLRPFSQTCGQLDMWGLRVSLPRSSNAPSYPIVKAELDHLSTQHLWIVSLETSPVDDPQKIHDKFLVPHTLSCCDSVQTCSNQTISFEHPWFQAAPTQPPSDCLASYVNLKAAGWSWFTGDPKMTNVMGKMMINRDILGYTQKKHQTPFQNLRTSFSSLFLQKQRQTNSTTAQGGDFQF